MDTKTQLLDEIIQKELLDGCTSEDLSICNGRMGLTLFFFHCFRHTEIQMYEDVAGELLNDISEDIHTALPIDFQNGLCGIGWGIEYLIQNGYIEVSNDILEEIDLKIIEKDIRRMKDFSFETGLEGIAWYILLRLNSQEHLESFDDNYQKELIETCEKNKGLISGALLSYIKNRNTLQYSFEYIFDRILSENKNTLSWKNGLKQLFYETYLSYQ